MADAAYEVEGRQLVSAISKCNAVIALGTKAESNSIVLVFDKKSLTIQANNSVATYSTDLAVSVQSPTKFRATILPDMLVGFANKQGKLVLSPKEDSLGVKGGKGFSASLYYVGEAETLALEKPEGSEDLSKVATVANAILTSVAGMKNRTDKTDLGVILEWGAGELELIIGDSHHAVVVTAKLKQKAKGRLTMALPNLMKIMAIGNNFANVDNQLIAWSDSEYLSIANQSENIFLADQAKDALDKSKRTTVVTMDVDKFREMVGMVTDAVDETALVRFDFSEKEIKAFVSTQGGKAQQRAAVKGFKGKPTTSNVSVHHLKDCLSAMREKTVNIVLYNNMVALESVGETVTVRAMMAAMAAIK